MRFNTNTLFKSVAPVGLGLMLLAAAGCGQKAAVKEKTGESASYTAENKEPSAAKPSQGIVSMADSYIEEALSRPMDKLYIEAKASQSNEARFRLGLALLAGRSHAGIKDVEFKAPAMAEPRYWLERAKPKGGEVDAAMAGGKDKDYTPLTTYVFETGIACVADLKESLKTPTAIAIDQAKDSCWGEPAYERYKAELAKNP